MQFERRESLSYPEYYNGFYLVRTHGLFYGIPPGVDALSTLEEGNLFEHPAVLSAPSLPELQEQIDGFEEGSETAEVVGQFQGYNVVRLRGKLYGVPSSAAPGDLNLAEERRRVGAISARNREELEAAITRARAAVPVEFAGWLPIYKLAGNCGQHPQFLHTSDPPRDTVSPGPPHPCLSVPR